MNLVEGRGEAISGLQLIAIVVSRVEAAGIASMLGANGIDCHIDGFWHASAEVNTIALGGHRIYVTAPDYGVASDLLRETRADENWQFCYATRRAVVRLLAVITGFISLNILAGIAIGAFPMAALTWIPLAALNIPVNPQGRPDFFLAPPAV